jgi:hypothetical protein
MGGLLQKNFYGDVLVKRGRTCNRLGILRRTIDPLRVAMRACLDGVLSKKSERKIEICIKFDISEIFRFLSWRNWWVRGPWGHDLFSSPVIMTVLYLLTLSAFALFFISIFSSPFSHMRCISSPSVSPRCHSNSFLERGRVGEIRLGRRWVEGRRS